MYVYLLLPLLATVFPCYYLTLILDLSITISSYYCLSLLLPLLVTVIVPYNDFSTPPSLISSSLTCQMNYGILTG